MRWTPHCLASRLVANSYALDCGIASAPNCSRGLCYHTYRFCGIPHIFVCLCSVYVRRARMLKGTLLYLAHNATVRNFVIHNRATRAVSRRFVAGEALDDAIEATRALNQRNMHVSLDHLGENVSDAKEAVSAVQDYIAILDRIKQAGVDANISIKLTALGLDVSQELCEQDVCRILEHAQQFPI